MIIRAKGCAYATTSQLQDPHYNFAEFDSHVLGDKKRAAADYFANTKIYFLEICLCIDSILNQGNNSGCSGPVLDGDKTANSSTTSKTPFTADALFRIYVFSDVFMLLC